ncbi:uncharacterized protein LOC105662234 isoform X2 [Megachile rotundata]|uniref:uncharacterized protein LOC105662234 isoform X2 n=1 Tax=Megachile rotundata TaxID=143995 RepID=UPI000614A8B4|nr:PREDICTED: uncharacterized protein LOC105662234 isoform X2 [Megachile rotundata]
MLTKMSPYQQQYKEKKVGFGSTKDRRFIRLEEREESRKNQRAVAFNENRNIRMSLSNKSENKKSTPVDNDCLTRLMKWKAERQKRRRLEQTKKKPPFVVGVVRHKVYSPIKSQPVTINTTYEKTNNQMIPISPSRSLPKRITDATRKRLMSKVLARRLVEHSTNISKSINTEQKNQKQQEQSFAPKDHKFKAPIGLPHISIRGKVAIPSSSSIKTKESNTAEFIKKRISNTLATERQGNADNSRESLRDPGSLKLSLDETFTCTNENNNDGNDKVQIQDSSVTESVSSTKNMPTSTPNNSPNEPVFFSPYIVSSRGKSNARKEQQIKRGFSLNRSQSNDIPTKETVMKNLNISVEEEERTAQYFQFLLNKEIDRLNKLRNKWTDIKEDITTTPAAQHEINQVIGQINLLINKKFERFRRLVTDCETGKGEMLVTCKDLQGFWDMMYVEVKDCDVKFEQLEKLRLQDWKKKESPEPKKMSANNKKVIEKKKTAFTKPSTSRDHLAVKNTNVTQQINSSNLKKPRIINSQYVNNTYEMKKNDSSVKSKERLSLLQKRPVSATFKNTINSTMTKDSPTKISSVQLNNTISYINSDQTPRKSILKQATNSLKANYFVKPTSKVNFDDRVVLNEVPVDEDQLKAELGAALERIDSFDFDDPNEEEEEIQARMTLTFDDDSFEEPEDIKQNSESTDCKTNMDAKSIKKQLDANNDTPLSEKKLRRQNAVDEPDKELDKQLILSVSLTRLEEMMEDADVNKYKEKLYKHNLLDNKKEISPYNGSLRILRNRIISSEETPKRKRSMKSINMEESEYKENKTPLVGLRRSFVENEEKKDLRISLTRMSLAENSYRRKSRRSVKFSEQGCTGCVLSKPTLPMTPHIRRSRTKSNEKTKSIKSVHLKPWTNPKKPPDRVRRSRRSNLEFEVDVA